MAGLRPRRGIVWQGAYESGRALSLETASVAPVTEAVGALAIVVLAILGLVNVAPSALMAVATIVAGASLLLQSASTASGYAQLLVRNEGTMRPAALGGGITIEFLAGGVGIVLGILALLGAGVTVLVPAALIVIGATLLLSGGVTSRMIDLQLGSATVDPALQTIAHEAAGVAAGAQILIGLGVVVLGILALVPIHAPILILVGLLAIGTSLLVTSTTIGGTMLGLLGVERRIGSAS